MIYTIYKYTITIFKDNLNNSLFIQNKLVFKKINVNSKF